MIPNATDRTISGNLSGQKVTMGFAKGAERHLLGLLTDMYSDTELAVIREYSTNAHDSHVMAGVTRPIEVTLPSPLSPFFSVQDFGLGLSVDDIHNIYSQYGASTKRESNDANGMLGIGCKAALAYGAQFTVVGVKAGVRVTVAVSRDVEGVNSMTIVDTSATTDSNGVTISVPAKSGNQFAAKAAKFFANWEPGTVLVNGEQPDHLEGLKVTDTITLVETGRYSSESYIVMAGVTYPAGEKLTCYSLGIPGGYGIVATVPTGSVDFAPSREALTFSNVTNEVLDQVRKDFKANIVAAVQRELEDQPDRASAVSFVNKWNGNLGNSKPKAYRYRGVDLPTSIVRPSDPRADGTRPRMLLTSASNYKLSSASNVNVVDLSYLDRAVWVTGYNMASFTVTHKKKLLKWAEDKNISIKNFVLVDFPLDTTWIAPARVVAWADIHAIKLPAAERTASGRLPGSYDICERKLGDDQGKLYTGLPGSSIDQTNPVYWFPVTTGNFGRWRIALDRNHPAYTVVLLPTNRVAKFTRENPSVQNVKDVVTADFKAWDATITDDQRLACHLDDEGELAAYKKLAPSLTEIADPEVRRGIALSKVDIKAIRQVERIYGMVLNATKAIPEWDDPMKRYPLFPESYYGFDEAHREHVVDYMNFVYRKPQVAS